MRHTFIYRSSLLFRRSRNGADGRRGGFVTANLLLGLTLASVLGTLSGCARPPAPDVGGAPLISINKIESREIDGKVELVIEGVEPILQYTSFQLTEPLRLVLDISDADISRFTERLVVNKDPVIDITPVQQDNIARLEIGLTQAVEARVSKEGERLVIEFDKPIAAAKQETPAPPVPAQETPAEEGPASAPAERPTASLITAVKATADAEGARVVITADGTMAAKILKLTGNRIAINISGTKSRVRPNVIPVRKSGLERVRIGQHPDKVSVVLDLTRQMDYAATPKGNQLLVSLVPGLGGERQVEKAAPAGSTAEEKETAEASKAPAPVPRKERAVRRTEMQMQEEDVLSQGRRYTGRRITLDFQDADIVNILRMFAELANLNMIISPEVKGKVTVRMVNIPWDHAMDIILKMNGLGYVREEGIIRIASTSALTREAEEEAKAKEAKKKAEDLITRIIAINYTSAKSIEGTLKKSLSARGETVVDDRTNTIIVKDIARNVDEVVNLVKLLDKPTPQVMIEARIVEATTSFTRDIGVQWGGKFTADAAYGNPTGLAFPNTISVTGGPTMGTTISGTGNYFVNLPAAAGAGAGGAVGISFGSLGKALNLDLVLSAMESSGEGKVISTPRVSALDNKEAKIEQGQSIPYATSSASGTQVQFIDAKLALSVTPHVTPDNKIFMKIKAQKNAPDTSLLGAGGQPSIRKNEAETEILLSDGETAVIGGILIIDRGQTIQKVPFFADLPLIGWLFKQKTMRDDKRELIIFITPRIVKQEAI